ncbi:unnamed protein product [Xylocopa violacea]|uniref:Mitochondrial import inner membrane translocase subunit n=1 Tax=Xylocopa violacea TaxID=135666 RepID=A0ABP1NXF9_XYLVO
MTDYSSVETNNLSKADTELQEFIIAEKQKAQFHSQVHELNDICWNKCVDKPGAKMDFRTENCLSNCAERFVDVSMLITYRFAQLLQKSIKNM